MKVRPARPFFLFASNLEAISMHATIEQVENISQINKVADLDTAWYFSTVELLQSPEKSMGDTRKELDYTISATIRRWPRSAPRDAPA